MNFKEEVLEQEGKVLVKFGAEWCGPCKALNSLIDHIKDDNNVVSIDIDGTGDETDIVSEYGIRGIPTVILFENGVEKKRKAGAMSKKDLDELLS